MQYECIEILPQMQLTEMLQRLSLERVLLFLQLFLPLHNQCIHLIHYDCFVSEIQCVAKSKKLLLADFIFSKLISGVLVFFFMVSLVMTPEIMLFYSTFLRQCVTMGTNILI
jgi:hypothetical protein